MSHVRWSYRPDVHDPVIVTAFEGWNDAGDAASSALRYLRDRWEASPFADIDPEDFYDFTETRPQVRLDDDDVRHIEWPVNELSAGRIPGTDRDVILLLGVEPQLRWRTFCEQVIDVARALGARMTVTLGSLLAEVAHSRPVSVVGSAYDADLVQRLGLESSRYEGPTGIVGVLHTALRDEGIPSASLWAAVPSYVPGAQSPKATLALVQRTAMLLDVGVVATDLEIASAAYERQINELVSEDDETAAYVAALEERHDDVDDQFPSGRSLVEEVERFLRERPGD